MISYQSLLLSTTVLNDTYTYTNVFLNFWVAIFGLIFVDKRLTTKIYIPYHYMKSYKDKSQIHTSCWLTAEQAAGSP